MPTIISPESPVLAESRPLAPRPASLAGLRIGILDNSKANAGRLLERVREQLVERYGAVSGPSERKSSSGIPAPSSIIERLRYSCDLVLTASADCGSCASGCVQDTVALEDLGIPSVLLGTDEFSPLVFKLAGWLGHDNIQAAFTSHPLGAIGDAAVDAKAPALADIVAQHMLASVDVLVG